MTDTTHEEEYIPEILYEDNHIIAVNKKWSQIVQGDKTDDTPMSDQLKQYIKIRDNKPGNVFLGVVHRLDRPVSGVILFAKTSKGQTRLNELFREDRIEKVYWAIVKNKPPKDKDTLVHYLTRNEKRNKSYANLKQVESSKRAELEYTVKLKSDNYYLLEIKLLTGRHHQIRCQLSAIGCPIKGDLKYGSERSNPGGTNISLHARYLGFVHPVTQQTVAITAPVPNEPIWKYFEGQL